MKCVAAALLVAFTCCGCDGIPVGNGVAKEDVLVLRALVDSACKIEWKEVISDLPATPYEPPASPAGARAAPPFGLDPSRRAPPAGRWPRGHLCPGVDVIADASISAVMKLETSIPPTWEHFQARFGDAHTLVRVSLPVYSNDGRRAVVYVSSTCPYSCGSGFYQELRKTPEGWRIRNSLRAWSR